MKKQIKSLLTAAVMTLALSLQAFAAPTDAQANFQPNGNQANVSVVLQHQDAGAGVTALEMTFHLEAKAGSLSQAELSFEFNSRLPGNIQEYQFDEQDKTLTVYVAGAKDGLFRNGTANLGTIKLASSQGERIQVEVLTGYTAPDAVLSDDLKILTGGTTQRSMAMEESTVLLDTNKEETAPSPDRPSRPDRPSDSDDDSDSHRPSKKPNRTEKPQEDALKPEVPPVTAPAPVNPQGTTVAAAAGTTQQTPAVKTEGAYSEDELKPLFANAADRVELDVTKRTQISDKVFAMLKAKGDTVLKLTGENYTWLFDSRELQDTAVAGGLFDSAVSLTVNEQAEKAIREFAKDAPYVAFETAYSGALPGKAVLTLQLDEKYAGETLYVYHQPEQGEPEQIAQVTADENGIVEISMEHCSVYFLTTQELLGTSEEDVEPGKTEAVVHAVMEEPSSPSLALILAIVAVVIVVIAAIGFYFYRKKQA